MVLNMLQQNHSRAGGLAVRVLGSLAVLAGLVAIMYFALPKESATQRADAPNVRVDDQARRCEDQLADLIEGLTPGRLGISSDRAQIIDRLNSWRGECGEQTGTAQPSSDTELIRKLLSGEALARTLSERYLAEDAMHVRMSLLARDIATNVVEGNISNVDRAVSLFEFVSRNVMLINQEIRDQTQLTPYECLVFGLGTAEDRAWTFAELLRQIRTDAVILTPLEEAHADNWLIGVIEPQLGILLFDPRMGIPIPALGSPTDTFYPKVPATLKSVVESDAAFRELDLPDAPYPLNSAAMKTLRVSLIGSSSGWAPRMALLQFLLPQGISVDLYDGLGANELRSPGVQQRVVDAGQGGLWSPENVSVWAYPELAQTKFEATRGEGEKGSQLESLQFVFKGPYVPRPVGNDGKTFQPTPIEKSLHFVRIEQLRGKYANAIRDYLPIRTTVKLVPNPANEMAAEFATLWTGVSQYETQKIRTALGTFDRYAVSQARSVGMTRTAVEYLADCMLAQKNYEAAVQILQKAPPGFAPHRDAYLIRRWQKIAGIDPDKAPMEKKAPEKAAEESSPTGTGETAKPAGVDTKPVDTKPGAESKPGSAEKTVGDNPKPETKAEPAAEE